MGRTSIPCTEETRELLKRDKERREMGWDEYLQLLAGKRSDSLRSKVERLEGRVEDIEAQMNRY